MCKDKNLFSALDNEKLKVEGWGKVLVEVLWEGELIWRWDFGKGKVMVI